MKVAIVTENPVLWPREYIQAGEKQINVGAIILA